MRFEAVSIGFLIHWLQLLQDVPIIVLTEYTLWVHLSPPLVSPSHAGPWYLVCYFNLLILPPFLSSVSVDNATEKVESTILLHFAFCYLLQGVLCYKTCLSMPLSCCLSGFQEHMLVFILAIIFEALLNICERKKCEFCHDKKQTYISLLFVFLSIFASRRVHGELQKVLKKLLTVFLLPDSALNGELW